MGCGSSSTAAAPLTPVLPQDGTQQHKGKGKQQQPQPSHTQPSGGNNAEKDAGLQKQSGGGGGVAGDAEDHSAPAPAPPAPKEKLKMKRLTDETHQQHPHPHSSAPACDVDGSHDASLFCAQCEQNFCAACDASTHQPGAAHKHQHHRTALKSTGNGAKSKFVLKPNTAADASAATAADGAASPADDNGAASPEFKVGKFVHVDGDAAAPSPSPPPVPPQEPVDMDSSVGLRLKHAHNGALLNVLAESELSCMNRYELELLWHRYDKDKNLVLSREELKALAADVIARVEKLIEDDLVKHNPGLSPAQVQQKIEEEKAFVLPGKNRHETRKEMTASLVRALDVNHDGRVTKAEYLAQWNEFAQEMFHLKQEGAIACSIM